MKVHELFAYIAVADAARAIEFYSRAFGAREKFRLTEPSGRIGHAELDFDGITLMLSDESCRLAELLKLLTMISFATNLPIVTGTIATP